MPPGLEEKRAVDWDQDLDQVLAQTLKSVQRARDELFYIAEDTRREFEETRSELERVRAEVHRQIQRVDQLVVEDRQARARLLEVTQAFRRYRDDERHDVHDPANHAAFRTISRTVMSRLSHAGRNTRRSRPSGRFRAAIA